MYTSPIGGIDLYLDEVKTGVLEKFDEKESFINPFERTPEIEYYKVVKRTILPNGKETLLIGTVGFLSEKLIYFRLELPIGGFDYYPDLKKILERADSEGVNNYVYESDNYVIQEVDSICTKIWSFGRSYEVKSEYAITFKYSKKIKK